MNDRRYLLSITELLEGTSQQSAEQLGKFACEKLDGERLRKVQRITSVRKRAESIGAGLVLQLGLQEYEKASGAENAIESNSVEFGTLAPAENNNIQHVTVSQILAKLGEPIQPEYIYNEKGKPYFKNISLYFNLSHSGEYVFCVFSEQEVGVDIQYRKPGKHERIVRRFFVEAEQDAWKVCASSAEQERFFYKLWARKEAYGKLTGEGVAEAMAMNVLAETSKTIRQSATEEKGNPAQNEDSTQNEMSAGAKFPDAYWEEYEYVENYQIAVCKYAAEKE